MPRTGLSADDLRCKAIKVTRARIAAVGYDKLRVTDVAAELGLSHAALYAHFRDKAALLDAVVDQWLEEGNRQLTEAAGAPGPAEERIAAWFLTRLRLKRDTARLDPELFNTFHMASDRLRGGVRAHLAFVRAQLAELIAEAHPEIRNPQRAARLLLTGMAAFTHPRLITDQIDLPDAEVEAEMSAVLSLLLRGLSTRPA